MSTSPTPQLRVPVIAGRYAVRQKLGSGSTGTVYLAFDKLDRKPVALKVIRTERLLAGPVSSMQNEFRTIASLRHPCVATAFDFGYTDEGGIPFYTREYIDGDPLPPGPPSARDDPGKFLRPILDLLEALEYLHEQGILHLDVHSGNLIVAEDKARGSVLIDIGLKKSLDRRSFSVSSGTWSTLPPEMISREDVGEWSDLFLVGRLLYYRLTGRASGEPKLPREIPRWGTHLTLGLERIIVKALQPAPEQRFQTARDFRSALSEILGETRERSRPRDLVDMLLGRERELADIEKALERAGNGEPALLRIGGTSGVGKSRLLEEARIRAQLRGLITVEVRFSSEPEPPPALVSSLRVLETRSETSVCWLDALAPQFGGSPQERAQRAAASYFLEAGNPLVLLLDDFDHADRDSRTLVHALVTQAVRRKQGRERGRGLALILSSSVCPACGSRPHCFRHRSRNRQLDQKRTARELEGLAESRGL